MEGSTQVTFLLKIPSAICRCKAEQSRPKPKPTTKTVVSTKQTTTIPSIATTPRVLTTGSTATPTRGYTTTPTTGSTTTRIVSKKLKIKKSCKKSKKNKTNFVDARRELKMSLKFKQSNKGLNLKNSDMNALSEIDCGDKKCSLHHRYVEKCTVFLHTNVTNCKIPCQLDGCKTEIRHYMNCPIWECNYYTTTPVPSTTSTESSTSAPAPAPPSFSTIDIVLYMSLGINGLFFLALIIFIAVKICKKKLQYRRTLNAAAADAAARNASFPILPPTDNRFFSLASRNESNATSSNENIPLLPRNQSQRSPNFYCSSRTSPVSLGSTPETRNAEEEMLSRVTSFKPVQLQPIENVI